MAEKGLPLYVGVETVKQDLGELNNSMKAEYPRAIIVSGKVNRIWYEEACLRSGSK